MVHATNTLFKQDNLWRKPPTKRTDKSSLYAPEDIAAKLNLLRDEAVYTVLERLRLVLRATKKSENHDASNDVLTAAAQNRILLPGADAESVGALVRWVYKSPEGLAFSDVTQLYAIYGVAEKLGIAKLAAECMATLTSATARLLQSAKEENVSLRDLLDVAPQHAEHEANVDPLSDPSTIGAVFKITLNTPSPPALLQDLVADALAASHDDALIVQLMPCLNLEMRGKITVASMRIGNEREKRRHSGETSRGEHDIEAEAETGDGKAGVKRERKSDVPADA